jgi:hypothetical protein
VRIKLFVLPLDHFGAVSQSGGSDAQWGSIAAGGRFGESVMVERRPCTVRGFEVRTPHGTVVGNGEEAEVRRRSDWWELPK